MKLIPFDKYTIESNYSQIELTSRLSDKIEPKVLFRVNNEKPYEGKIEGNSFKIKRILQGQNPFRPIIKGEFKTKYGGGSKIEIKMRMNYLILLFIIFWLLGVGFFILFFSTKMITDGNLNPTILIGVLMFIIGYGITIERFNKERKKSEVFLNDLFK